MPRDYTIAEKKGQSWAHFANFSENCYNRTKRVPVRTSNSVYA